MWEVVTDETRKKSAAKTLKFLESLRKANLPLLEAMLRNHNHKKCPRWKRVAIRRAIAKFRPCTQEWIHGLDELERELPHMKPWQVQLIAETQARFRAVLSE